MSIPLTLRRATSADIPDIVDVHLSAIADSPFEARCFPATDPATRNYYLAYITRNLHDITLACDAGGVVLGYVRWVKNPRKDFQDSRPEFRLDMYPSRGDQELAMRYLETAYENRMQSVGGESHCFLSMLMVKKEMQRKRVGAALLDPCLRQADDYGWPCFVNGSTKGRGLYEKLGFQVVGMSIFQEGICCYHMEREPKL
ncbi:acyl-CoA N-acyltransferase [Stachybotrys elegans]|uniref:Acyl-CoA N-acyltransferase n=1 Tax=Stachybotrys elegans TaxID=80388 RepID=A0A8K0SM44_9HYPO|nr:acyl-CoA N-acyltransferase [Stachybotrys elegans]